MENPAYQDVCCVATSGEVPPPFDRETMEKLHVEAKRAEDLSRHKFEEEKQARKAQEKRMSQDRVHKIKDHARTKVMQHEERPLSKAFSGSIEAAQLRIINKATSTVDSPHINTASGLHDALGELKDVQQQQQSFAHHTAKAPQDDPNEFSARDTKQSRVQRRENWMRPVSEAIAAGDEELARQQAEWNMIDAELRRSTEELFGSQNFEQVLSHRSNHGEPQSVEMRKGTETMLREAEDSPDQASQSTPKEWEGVDEAHKTRRRVLDHSFMTLLNDDEY